MKIIEPIFIIGSGRSGTTLFSRMLAVHPDLAYFSSWTNRFPKHSWLAVLSRLNDLDFIEENTRYTKKWPRITEAYNIWDMAIPTFSRPINDMQADDATPEQKQMLRELVWKHMQWQGKNRFLAKYVGWMRINLIRDIFPDAHFICMDRDPRATLYSQMQLKWGYEGNPAAWEEMSVEDRLRYYVERYILYLDYKANFKEGIDYHQFYYEPLVKNPLKNIKEICEKVNLPTPKHYLNKIATWKLSGSMNERWRTELSESQIKLFNELLITQLKAQNYSLT